MSGRRSIRAFTVGLVAVVSGSVSCVIPSRTPSHLQQAPMSPAPVVELASPPAAQPAPGPVHGIAETPSRTRGCELSYVAPFDGKMVWRAAYRGAGRAEFHHCPGWSRFGPVRPNGKWHRGVDIAAPTSTPIRAAVPGMLSYGRDPNGWGLYARVRFTPTRTGAAGQCEPVEPMELVYGHLREDIPAADLRSERPVEPGEVVGRVGCSGNARGMCSPSPESHVHVSLLYSKGKRERIDPIPVAGWELGQPEAGAFSPPLLACPIRNGELSASSR